MHGYLLDTNIVAFWLDPTKPEHAAVVRHAEELPEESPLAVSAITLGEIEYGLSLIEDSELKQEELLKFLADNVPRVLDVRKSTRIQYGSIRARLFEKYAPRDRRKRSRRPEQLIDPVTSLGLQVQENDLWIAAQALEHNLVLVTHDDMLPLRSVVEELRIEYWATLPEKGLPEHGATGGKASLSQ